MKSLVDQLSNYAAYHRNWRNIQTHFIGIPMIVVAATILLARPGFEIGGWIVSPALIVAALLTLYYLKLDLRYGISMGILLALSLVIASQFSSAGQTTWLAAGIGLFVVGWVFQFIGHHFEGRKPAFFDDIMGLAIGPLFVLAEAGFLLGLRKDIEREIEARFA